MKKNISVENFSSKITKKNGICCLFPFKFRKIKLEELFSEIKKQKQLECPSLLVAGPVFVHPRKLN